MSREFKIETDGIKAKTWDNKEFYFYIEIQSDVENTMILMGYDTHGYWLSFFKDRPEPETPPQKGYNTKKRRLEEKMIYKNNGKNRKGE